jgi:phosphatidylglycerol:prolipoprotein diacylglycerol transferase
MLFRKKYQNLGFMTGMYLISYAIIRFMIEFLRGDPRATVGPLSISQAISIGLIAVGIFAIAYSRRKRIIT